MLGQGPRAARDGPGRGGRDGHHGVDRRRAAPGRPRGVRGPRGRHRRDARARRPRAVRGARRRW